MPSQTLSYPTRFQPPSSSTMISLFFAFVAIAVPTITASTNGDAAPDAAAAAAASASTSVARALPPPLAPFPEIPDEDVASISFPQRLGSSEDDETEDDDADDDDDDDDGVENDHDDENDVDAAEEDDDVAFSVYEIDADEEDGKEEEGRERAEEADDEANDADDDANDDANDDADNGETFRHKRNKRFVVVTRGSQFWRGRSKRRRNGNRGSSSSSSSSSSSRTGSRGGSSSSPASRGGSSTRKSSLSSSSGRRRTAAAAHGRTDDGEREREREREKEREREREGHGYAEGAGSRGERGIKFTKRINIRKSKRRPSSSTRRKSSSTSSSSSYSSSSPSSSSSSSSSSKSSKQSLPDRPIWQIKWPKGGNAVRTAIRENEIFKEEVMKLKLKIGSLTEEQKKLILDQHNKYRGQLPGVRGYAISNIPRAQDMQKMVWDEELEKKAKIHAEKCLFAHDTRKERHLDNLIVGQNIAVDTSSTFVETAVAKWYGEIALCKWDLSGENAAKRQNKRCTEYAQLVWSNSSRLGCASVWCPEITDWPHTGYNLVCDYGPEGNTLRMAPYTPAKNDREICKKCPGKCVDSLCDCGGKVCYNGGSMDVRTCQCSCTSLWNGPTCLVKSCPDIDPEACGLPYPKGYPKSYCSQYLEVKHKCPYMCGVCKGARCGGKKCVNGGKLDFKTCECQCRKIFTGDTCNKLTCPPQDSWFCGTKWDKSYCKRIITAQFECPYMCNICRK